MTVAPPPAADGAARKDPRGRRARLTARFLLAVGEESASDDLTPAALARAVVRVLPVDGAGLSTMTDLLRVPLGSSSPAVAQAEVLQTSLGEGPCLHAAQVKASVVLELPELRRSWPTYTERLVAETPFRAVASIPLYAPGHVLFAALDVYAHDPGLSDRLDLVELDEGLAAPAAALLTTCVEQVVDVGGRRARPEWYETAAGRRHDVWVAMGMVIAHRSSSGRPVATRDALSLLRAHAHTHDRSLDDVAAEVVRSRVPPSLGDQAVEGSAGAR